MGLWKFWGRLRYLWFSITKARFYMPTIKITRAVSIAALVITPTMYSAVTARF